MNPHVLLAVPLLPLLAAIIAGLGGRLIGRTGAPDEAPAQARDDGGHERQQRHGDQHGGVHARAQPFSVFRSSTLMLRRSLNSTTRMASPIADSAAATVRMKNTNTCPLISAR